MKNEKTCISVVMVNYNGLRYLKRTIHPILNLDYPNIEFIIVDNGSTDGSIEFLEKFDKIRLIKSPRLREKNYACNYAVKKSIGEYVFLCDNDLLVQNENLLTELLSKYQSLKNCGTLTVAYYDEGKDKTHGYGVFYSYMYNTGQKAISIEKVKNYDGIEVGYPHGVGFLVSKRLWKQVGGYNTLYKFGGDDDDLGLKVILLGYRNYLYSKVIQVHIGAAERADNEKFQIKFKEIFFSKLSAIVIYFQPLNIFVLLVVFSFYSLLRSLKQSLARRHLGPLIAFFQGYLMFFKNLTKILDQRKKFNLKRKVDKDIQLYIKPIKLK